MGTISIKGMEFFAYHGCFSEEQIIGNHFIVDLDMITNTSKAQQNDDIAETVNYQAVYGFVKNEMEKNSNLIEHVAHRIINVVQKEFPEIDEITLTVSKLNPPVGGKVDRVCFTLTEKK